MFSKLAPIQIECKNYVHPWTESCLEATMGAYIQAIIFAFKIYGSVHLLALLMKGIPPRKDDIKKTLIGIFQSSAFLSGNTFGYSLFLCIFRRVLGNFNILTASFVPSFLASIFAILIEKPSRRTLLALYLSNIATETVWNMLVSRKTVQPIRFGEVAIFAGSISVLLTIFRSGLHLIKNEKHIDPLFKVLRLIIGKDEETIKKTKKLCPHRFSCLNYILKGTSKIFLIGLSIQLGIKLVLNAKILVKTPTKFFFESIFRLNSIKLATFLAGTCGIFRAASCFLRKITGEDHFMYAIPAGLLAGIAFTQYPKKTIALYVLWKTLHIVYNLGIDHNLVPEIPGFNMILYSLSVAILFHTAMFEPQNLRLSYWKFLYNGSAGRIACMDRSAFEPWGFGTLEGLAETIAKAKTPKVIQFTGIKW
nr:transmembrane protein 135-like [Onthophagus taurus]